MIYTTEFLANLPFDEVEEILRVKFALSKAPKYHPNPDDKQKLIDKIIEFQTKFGSTETKSTVELSIGDTLLKGGTHSETGITYDMWCKVTLIDKLKGVSSIITNAINESIELFGDSATSISTLTQDIYIIQYQIELIRFEESEWENESVETEANTYFAHELHIVKSLT